MSAFWDTSAVVPRCCFQPQSAQARQAARTYSRQVIWWGTVVEAVSSLNRLTCEGAINTKERLLRIHRLRAADALQLAAALVWCGNHPQGRALIGADGNLSDAASAEGFTVIHLL